VINVYGICPDILGGIFRDSKLAGVVSVA